MSCQVENAHNRNVRFKRQIRKGSSSLIPFIRFILNYSQLDAVADFITGITIGLIIIPQSVAYVAIVGLSAKVSTFMIHFLMPEIFPTKWKWKSDQKFSRILNFKYAHSISQEKLALLDAPH